VGISTLTSRKSIINNYKLRQHNYEDGKRELTTDEKDKLAKGEPVLLI
jgi:hypothetical protein